MAKHDFFICRTLCRVKSLILLAAAFVIPCQIAWCIGTKDKDTHSVSTDYREQPRNQTPEDDDFRKINATDSPIVKQWKLLELAQTNGNEWGDSLSGPPDADSELVVPAFDESMHLDSSELPSRNLDLSQTRPAHQTYNLPMDMTKEIDEPDELVDVKFNFDAESIVNVVQMFSLTLEFQYYIDPGVSGSVTMTIDTQMTRLEAWQLFEHILWITGSYASKQNGFIDILPFAKMPQERRIFAKHDPIPNVDVSIVRLFNTAAADTANLIKPFMTAGATASPIQHLNSLLIVEAPPNMPKILELIDKLDVLGETKWPQISIPLYHVTTEVILEELQQILPIIGFPVSGADRGDGHSIKLVALDRLQVLIAAAPVKEVLDEVKRWVRILDTEDTVEQERIFFYDVKYNKAEDLSDNIGIFFNASGSSTGGRRRRDDSGTTPTQTTEDSQQRRRAQQTRRQSPRRQRSSDEQPTTVFDIPVTILADGNHNRLVIRTTGRAYAMLEALLQRLDTPPLQVLMQVTVAEITLTDETSLGFQFATQIEKDFDININPRGSGENSIPALPIYSFNFRDADSVDTLGVGQIFSEIQAFAGESNTRILFSPQIMAMSDEEASINVGDSIPIATRQDSGSTTDSRILTDVQYQDTGTILTVTPYITAKKLVTLDIRQEVSDAGVNRSSSIDSPVISTRVVETSLVVEDGSTILIGGLISTDRDTTERGLPILKDVPYLGRFFRTSQNTMERKEILLLINVNVIDLETDVDELTKRYQAALRAIEEEFGERDQDEVD